MAKIYRKTFIAKATACIENLDNGVGIVEEQINQLTELQTQLGTSEFDDLIERMYSFTMDLYAMKNDYIDKLESFA